MHHCILLYCLTLFCCLPCLGPRPCTLLQADTINEMPLYPTEAVLFDENQVPTVAYTGEGVLALPKLNLQFLTHHDYLMRNFNLFRLEATYEIREDIADILKRVGPYRGEDDRVGS